MEHLTRLPKRAVDSPQTPCSRSGFLLKGKITYFVNTVFNYPTPAECYKATAFNGLNRLR